MKTAYLSFLLTALTAFFPDSLTQAQTIHIQGEQTGILQADTVMLVGNVQVAAGGTLVFLPGTTVIATGFFGFEVEGTITAAGTAGLPIFFTVADTAGFHNQGDGRGGWNGFHYLETTPDSDSSVFSHCYFEFGKAWGDSLGKMGGLFNIRHYDKISISDCEFFCNTAAFWGGAVFGEQCNIRILNCTFNENSCGTPGPPYGYGGALCLINAVADVTGCTFSANSSTGIGGAVSFEYADVLLSANIFQNNFSALGGALGYLRSTPTRPVTGNLFSGNSSQFFGGAISCNRANPRFINNTIVNNSSVSYGGGFYCNDSAVPVLINTIIYDNFAPEGSQVYIWDVNSAPGFYNCDIQGGSAAFGGTGGIGFNSAYVNNIDSIPSFAGIQPHPYSLADGSPCINKGTTDTTGLLLIEVDLAGNPRISGPVIDIGAYENQNGSLSVNRHSARELAIWPNPCSEELNISVPWTPGKEIDIHLTDMQGKLVFSMVAQYSRIIPIRFNHNNYPEIKPGLYLLTVSDGNNSLTKKLSFTH